MEEINAVRAIKLKQWADMIQACRRSGQTVNTWCSENGINPKTYYYRLKQVRREALRNAPAIPGLFPIQRGTESTPVFAEVTLHPDTLPKTGTQPLATNALAAAITIGELTISIYNEANPDIIASIIKAASITLP